MMRNRKRINKVLLQKRDEWRVAIIGGIVSGLISAILFSTITLGFDIWKGHNKYIKTIESIYIGSNKDWIDTSLGPATFSYQEGNILECTYLSDIASIRVFFDNESLACKAFFVTSLSEKRMNQIQFPEAYAEFVNQKCLNEFSFREINGSPENVCGYGSNGFLREFYSEKYYYAGGGNYYEFYFAYIDYGVKMDKKETVLTELSSDPPFCSDDEINPKFIDQWTFLVIPDRDKYCPNTYGIADPSYESYETIIDLFKSYRTFDSAQIVLSQGNYPY